MNLYLHKVIHPQAHDNYRVILKGEDDEVEIGSIGIQHAAGASYFWAWGIDTVIRCALSRRKGNARTARTVRGSSRRHGSDEVNLTEFPNAKRRIR